MEVFISLDGAGKFRKSSRRLDSHNQELSHITKILER
jgi:hypothetical protein